MIINLKKLISVFFGCLLIILGIIFFLFGIFGMQSEDEKQTAMETNSIVMGEIDPTKPMVALTYDDGPYAPVTDRILESLKAVNGRATFFVVGNRINTDARQETVKRIVEYGSEIGNHTYSHCQLNNISQSNISDQLKKTDDTVYELTGYSIAVIRPPAGCYSKTTLKSDPRPFVLWSIDTMDWSHQNADKTVERVLNNVKDGDIVLMHDLFFATAEASEILIPALVARNYQLVTVSELLEYRQESDSVILNK